MLYSIYNKNKSFYLIKFKYDNYFHVTVMVAALLGAQGYKKNTAKLHSGTTLRRLSAEVHLVFQESARLSLIPARLARSLHLPVWGRFERCVDRALHGGKVIFYNLCIPSVLIKIFFKYYELNFLFCLMLHLGCNSSYSEIFSCIRILKMPKVIY